MTSPVATSVSSKQPTATLAGTPRVRDQHDPRSITAAHHRRLDSGRLLATSPRLDWAKLLRRTYDVDVFVCPRCQGPARVAAAITKPDVIRKILGHLREPPARAPPSGARDPEFEGDVGGGDDDVVWLDPRADLDAE